jgi:DNA-binding NarL/FixJ family response regulator
LRDDDSERAQRQAAAVGRAAARLAPLGSLTATLDGVASEVARTFPVVGVQILAPGDHGGLGEMGSAGFSRWPDFFDRLVECRRRGAALRMHDALSRGEPVVVTDRWTAIRDDPAWLPLRDYLAELAWGSFASIPLMPGPTERTRAAGVLNVFLAPGQPVSDRMMDTLAAMAEQAAIAVGYAALIRAAREAGRREEREARWREEREARWREERGARWGHTNPDQSRRLRVLVAEEHAMARRGIRGYLEARGDMTVVAEAGDGQEAVNLVNKLASLGEPPDVALLGLVLPGLDGVAATTRIRASHPSVRVVIVSGSGEREQVRAALARGAAGYLLKTAGPAEVGAAVAAAARDEVFLDSLVARQLARELAAPPSGLGALTGRERATLTLLAEGLSNREIAVRLVLSERTVRNHVTSVLRKLQVSSRTQAALLAVREGLPPARERAAQELR